MIKTLIVGFIVGLLARAIKSGDDSVGWIMTIILGIAGASVGHYLAELTAIDDSSQVMSLGMSVLGAFILLSLYKSMVGGK